VPPNSAEQVRQSLFRAGAGCIGNYSHCSFNASGEGTYLGNEESKPAVGEKEVLQIVKDCIALYKKKSIHGRRFAEVFTDADFEDLINKYIR